MSGPSDTIDTELDALEADLVRGAIDTVIAPLIEADGGSIELVSVSDHAVSVRLGGACLGCPARNVTRDDVLVPILTRVLGIPVHVELV